MEIGYLSTQQQMKKKHLKKQKETSHPCMIFMSLPLGCDTDSVTVMKTKLVSQKEELQRFQKDRMQEEGHNSWILGCPEVSQLFQK